MDQNQIDKAIADGERRLVDELDGDTTEVEDLRNEDDVTDR